MRDYASLKSGTDIRGIASDIFGEKITLSLDAVENIVAGFVSYLEKKIGKQVEDIIVAVGHDSRITGNSISSSVISTLLKMGVKVYNCGLSSTPAMFMATIDTDADASVQITASHHPADRNGLKFFTRNGGLDSEEITEIISFAKDIKVPKCEKNIVENLDFMSTYAKKLRSLICGALGVKEEDMPLNGFKIVVDAGNGAGGFYERDVLKPLGANTKGSVFLEPDGMFPNHIPNPEDKKAMQSICEAVINSKADIGIIFDTDVDRAGCVDFDGSEINRNRLIALSAAIVMEDNPGATIVTDSVTSDGLKEFIEANLGGKHHRYKRGYKNVINEAIRLCGEGINSPLAIETSGHAALKENYFLDDGAYLVTKIIIKMVQLKKQGKTINDLISCMKMPQEAREIRFKITTDNFRDYGQKIISEFEKFFDERTGYNIADDNREGVRVSNGNGWVLLRMSVHDPIMPMNIESNDKGGVIKILKDIKPFFDTCKYLDITPLNKSL